MRLYMTNRGVVRSEADGRFGVIDVDGLDLQGLLESDRLADAISAPAEMVLDTLGDVEVLAPVRPTKFVIVGLNFRSHVDEFAEAFGIEPNYDVGEPFVAPIPATPLAGPNDAIVLPTEAPTQVDYEGEVAVVIGRSATNIDAIDAWSYVAGLTAVNDVSARDVQSAAMVSESPGIGISKEFPTFKPIGPCLTTADEFDTSHPVGLDVGIVTRVNGEERQNGRTTEYLTPLGEVIAFVSRLVTLNPGDVICTGSPRGVGLFSGGQFLKPGDVVEIDVEGVGTLRNTVA